MRNIKLVSDKQLAACLNDLSSKQQCAVLSFIFKAPHCFTHEIQTNGGGNNIPQIARKMRPTCKNHNIFIINYLPHDIYRGMNRYGEPTSEHRWFVVSIEANHAD